MLNLAVDACVVLSLLSDLDIFVYSENASKIHHVVYIRSFITMNRLKREKYKWYF